MATFARFAAVGRIRYVLVYVAPAVGIGRIGGICLLRQQPVHPTLPMIPMPFLPGGFLEGISGCTPFPCGRLPGEDEAGHARPSQLFGLGRHVLTTATLRVQRLLHIVVELADGDRLVMVLVPPDREQVGDGLSAPVALLRLADPFNGVRAAQCQQRVTHPLAPLLETAKRDAGLSQSQFSPIAKL